MSCQVSSGVPQERYLTLPLLEPHDLLHASLPDWRAQFCYHQEMDMTIYWTGSYTVRRSIMVLIPYSSCNRLLSDKDASSARLSTWLTSDSHNQIYLALLSGKADLRQHAWERWSARTGQPVEPTSRCSCKKVDLRDRGEGQFTSRPKTH